MKREIAIFLALLSSLAMAAIQDGPGLPNLAYTAAEVGKPISFIMTRSGHGWVGMHRGYLMVIYAADGGRGEGALSFWDIGDPRNPKLVHKRDDDITRELREPHGWGMRDDVACMQANYGMHFWDLSEVTRPELLSYLKLPGITISDYDQGLWWTCWQGGYAYGGGSGNGLYVVNATDPAKPRLLATQSGGASYSSMFNGGKMLMAGSGSNNGRLVVYDLANPIRIALMGTSANQGDKGGYSAFADGFAFAGFSSRGFAKFDLSKPDFPVVSSGSADIAGYDEDFATPLGNLVFAGNDHAGKGSALIPHQAGLDKLGPWVNFVSPADGAGGQPITSRVGVTFTDAVEKGTLTSENFTVRKVGGAALEGWYAHQSGIVNFTPKAPLAPGTQYEVVIRQGGVMDYAGNANPKAFRSVFTTRAGVTGLAMPSPRNGTPEDGLAGTGWIGRKGFLSPVYRKPGLASPADGAETSMDAKGRSVP